MNINGGGYEEEDFDSGDGLGGPTQMKSKNLGKQRRRKSNKGGSSDLEATGE